MPASASAVTNFSADRAQILAHHNESVAMALQRQDSQQVLGVIANIGALRGGLAVRHPIQAEEAHHVIDAQGPAVARTLADRLREQPVTVGAMLLAIGRRETPVLAVGGEVVGGRADAAAGNIEGPVRPQVRAEPVGRQREVVIQADLHALRER